MAPGALRQVFVAIVIIVRRVKNTNLWQLSKHFFHFKTCPFQKYWYLCNVSDTSSHVRQMLRRTICGSCKTSNWIPSDLPALDTLPCTKCGHPVILAWKLRQFELREIIAS